MDRTNHEKILYIRYFLHNKIDSLQDSQTIDQKIQIILEWFIGHDLYDIKRIGDDMEITIYSSRTTSTILDKPILIYYSLLNALANPPSREERAKMINKKMNELIFHSKSN